MDMTYPDYDVCVVGLGYIGLPTALVLSSHGLKVHGVDTNVKVVRKLTEGSIPIAEPGLQELLNVSRKSGLFSVSDKAVGAKNFIIAVPTPLASGESFKEADLTYVRDALSSIAPNLLGGELIINESTSPPGTTNEIADLLASLRPDLSTTPSLDHSVYFAHCPERVIPGRTLYELSENSRIIGGLNQESSARAAELYRTFCKGELLFTDAKTAELTKLAENSFRDVNIAFANELSDISESLGVNVWEVIELANQHPRVQILNPGPGVGGHCIAIDPWFIHQKAPAESQLIRLSRERNQSRPHRITERIVQSIGPNKESIQICALGLTFKANVDDLRESPSTEVVRELALRLPDSKIDVLDPYIQELPDSLESFTNLKLVGMVSSLNQYDVVVVLTDHNDFRRLQFPDRDGQLVFDTRGIWNK